MIASPGSNVIAEKATPEKIFGLPSTEDVGNEVVKRSVRYIQQLDGWLLEEQRGIKNSGYIRYHLTFRPQKGKASISFPQIIGPYHISNSNHQILACEANWLDESDFAMLIDIPNAGIKKIKHLGFFRDCGLTKDTKYYWLSYSDGVGEGENIKPVTDVIVLDKEGTVLKRERLFKAGAIKLIVKGSKYRLAFPEPELPG